MLNNSNKKLKAHIHKKIANIGLNFVLLITEVLIKGNNNNTKIALTIAITPPNLSGIDRKIA